MSANCYDLHYFFINSELHNYNFLELMFTELMFTELQGTMYLYI